MSLPARFTRVCYKVAGTYVFRGDLIVTRGVIYYFPLQHLHKSKSPDDGAAFGGVMGSLLGDDGSHMDESIKLFERPKLDMNILWRTTPPDWELQSFLDAHLMELKKYPSASGDDLPLPSRYPAGEIRNLVINSMGRLSFQTEFDEHVFKVGMLRRGKISQALSEAGFSQ
jgi:hypothetical protein